MSFFDSIPEPPPPPAPSPRQRPAWAHPEAVIPGSVPGELLLIRTGEVAVAIGSVRAYPTGFEFTVHVCLRHADRAGHRSPDPFEWQLGGQARDEVLRLGILYADGHRTATTSKRRPSTDTADDEPILQRRGGGGGDRAWHHDFWIYPLPPAGPVGVFASWLAHDVPETRGELDGDAIRAAAGRAVTLWPDDPDPESTSSWRSQTISAFRPAPPPRSASGESASGEEAEPD
jgi:hypothetical protein